MEVCQRGPCTSLRPGAARFLGSVALRSCSLDDVAASVPFPVDVNGLRAVPISQVAGLNSHHPRYALFWRGVSVLPRLPKFPGGVLLPAISVQLVSMFAELIRRGLCTGLLTLPAFGAFTGLGAGRLMNANTLGPEAGPAKQPLVCWAEYGSFRTQGTLTKSVPAFKLGAVHKTMCGRYNGSCIWQKSRRYACAAVWSWRLGKASSSEHRLTERHLRRCGNLCNSLWGI